MAQAISIGYVTADLEPKTSANGNLYIRFSLAEHLGYGDSRRTQYIQVWARREQANLLLSGKVKKGSQIWVSGQMELEEYTKRNGTDRDKRLKLTLDSWGYVTSGKPKMAPPDIPDAGGPPPMEAVAEIDGDREALPD